MDSLKFLSLTLISPIIESVDFKTADDRLFGTLVAVFSTSYEKDVKSNTLIEANIFSKSGGVVKITESKLLAKFDGISIDI